MDGGHEVNVDYDTAHEIRRRTPNNDLITILLTYKSLQGEIFSTHVKIWSGYALCILIILTHSFESSAAGWAQFVLCRPSALVDSGVVGTPPLVHLMELRARGERR